MTEEERRKKEEDKVLSMISQIQDVKLESKALVAPSGGANSPLRKPTRAEDIKLKATLESIHPKDEQQEPG